MTRNLTTSRDHTSTVSRKSPRLVLVCEDAQFTPRANVCIWLRRQHSTMFLMLTPLLMRIPARLGYILKIQTINIHLPKLHHLPRNVLRHFHMPNATERHSAFFIYSCTRFQSGFTTYCIFYCSFLRTIYRRISPVS